MPTSRRIESSRAETPAGGETGRRGRQRHCAEVKRLNSPATLRVKRLNCHVTGRKTARAVSAERGLALKAEQDASRRKREARVPRDDGGAGEGADGYRPCRDKSTKGCKGKSTVARIRAIVAFNDSFRDRSGISYNRLFDCLHGRLEERPPPPTTITTHPTFGPSTRAAKPRRVIVFYRPVRLRW